ncbi:hypothetical protein, partial [Paenibacillus aestuarii]|uniref:hypothetical protein n=1 Tax=Paenibacillus aestuarii TaxID=516965 RepID=UPI0022E9BDED
MRPAARNAAVSGQNRTTAAHKGDVRAASGQIRTTAAFGGRWIHCIRCMVPSGDALIGICPIAARRAAAEGPVV